MPPISPTLSVRKAEQPDLADIKQLLDATRTIFGFVPRPGIVEAIREQELFKAEQEPARLSPLSPSP